ncbi:VWA domain-containing protein, partial [Escherichia coli]
MILGRYADRALHGANFDTTQARLDKTLDYLYNREYQRRGHVQGGRAGSLDDSQLTALNWLEQARSLFP